MFGRGRFANRPYNGLILHAFLFQLRHSYKKKGITTMFRVNWRPSLALAVCFAWLVSIQIGCPQSTPQPDGSEESVSDTDIEKTQEASPDATEGTTETITEISPETVAETTTEISPETTAETTPDTITCQTTKAEQEGDIAMTYGTVRGSQEDGVWSYKGIPYAAPPLGPLRWKAPQPPACWKGIRPSTSFGSACAQVDIRTNRNSGAEDCLTLNLWRPAQATPQQPRPVMFFIHGGGNVQGSSSETNLGSVLIYNGKHLAKQHDVVVVTINYRLAALGYLALPELAKESPNKTSGNYGFLDQVFALQWVQQQIIFFGGDPDRVMIFGESAGAVNVCAHLASPLSKGLFHAALMQSGGCGAVEYKTAEANGTKRLDQSNCKDTADRLACLRGKDANEIALIFPADIGITRLEFGGTDRDYGPIIDGYAFLKHPTQTILAKEHNAVPTVIGSNADEYESLLSPTIQVPTQAAYETYVKTLLKTASPTDTDAILKMYEASNYPTPRDALVDLLTDLAFTCPTRVYTKNLAQNQQASVWRYFFSRRPKLPNREGKAAHGIELLYVFQSLLDIPLFTPDPTDLKISNDMMRYWSRLALHKDPNGPTLPAFAWNAYDPQKDNALQLDEPLAMLQGVRTDRCNLLERALTKP